MTIGDPDGAVTAAQAHEPVSLGSPSPPLPLVYGVTMIDVDLVARGGLAKTYQLVISRAAGVVVEPTRSPSVARKFLAKRTKWPEERVHPLCH